MKKNIHLFYSGVVQGVGFRFAAKMLANRHRISGWVRNLPDKRVEVVAQGENENLNKFLNGLKSEFFRNITDIEYSNDNDSGKCEGFQIR